MIANLNLPLLAGVFVGAYLVASANFSIIAARLMGKGDLRALGSRNAGATNLSRVAGKPVAVLVLLLDLGRAWGVVFLASIYLPSLVAPFIVVPFLLGNLFPVFHHFKGGKGVAAAVGLVLALNPLTMLAGGGVFLVALGLSKRVSPGSIFMAASYPVWMWLFGGSLSEIGVCAFIACLIAVTHRANISRMYRGEEPRLFRDANSSATSGEGNP